MTSRQRLYNGVRFPMDGPCLENVRRIDHFARPMIHAMCMRGMRVDLDHFAAMEKTLTEDLDRITSEVQAMTGVYCNLDSGDQVSALLFKKLKLKQARPSMTKSGDRESVENEVLVAIQHDHPVVPKILNYKELSKLRGTYVVPMPKLAQKVGFGHWRMFPKLGDTRVPSGRLNCKEPNLLAMPNRTERGRQVCEGFIAEEGWCYLSVDLSQIEPRVAAHRSQDAALMNIYFNEEDVYSDFATMAFHLKDQRFRDAEGWHYPGIDKKFHRFPSKTCILAAIYDVTNVGLLEQMPTVCKNCRKEATLHDCAKFEALWNEGNCQDILNSFYLRYPGILTMRKQDHQRARRHGYLWDEFGRILHVAAVRSVLEWVVSSALREAGNFPLQSTAQGILKLAMAQVWDDMVDGNLLDICYPQLQIHDELLFSVKNEEADEVGELVKFRMENCIQLRIPVKAGVATASNWGLLSK